MKDATLSNEAGFTLVEVLAALAIFSITAIGLVRVGSENAKTARMIESRALAAVVADNHLARTLVRARPPEPGSETTTRDLARRAWQIEETVSETSNPLVRQVRVAVRPVGSDTQAFLPGAEVSAFMQVNP